MPGSPSRGSGPRVLLTSVGTGRYERVLYAADGQAYESQFAPAATAAIEGQFAKAILLVTEEAGRTNVPALERELADLGIPSERHLIPQGRSEREVWAIFKQVLDTLAVGASMEVVLDITHAFRHLPVILFGSLAFLTAADRVAIRRLRYGAYEARVGNTVPLLDLTPLLTLLEAQHAVRQFGDTGDARRLARLLSELNRQLWTEQSGNPEFSRIVHRLKHLSLSVSAGLPIEAGLYARAVADALGNWSRGAGQTMFVIGETLIDRLRGLVEAFAVPSRERKHDLVLSLEELRRQLRIIRFYLDVGAHDRVLLLLREWIVNRCLLTLGEKNWLERGRRAAVERALNGLAERRIVESGLGGSALSTSTPSLGSLWARVRDLRNRVAHPGMCSDEVRPWDDDLTPYLRLCEEHCENAAWWAVHPGVEVPWILVTPLGLSPGVLYTALVQLRPPLVLVLTSREAAQLVDATVERAGFDASAVRRHAVDDAHRCFEERGAVEAWVEPFLLATRRVVLNITGGTTALQYLVESVGRRAERLGLRVERVALVDRRAVEEQRRDPYVAGEVVRLDDEGQDSGREESDSVARIMTS
jgi:CRISPR-associated DxTHG motif protein